MHGLLLQGVKCDKVPKGNLECTHGKPVVRVSLARMRRHEQQRRARVFGTSETRSCSRCAYEGEGKQWAEEVERELAEMNVSLEQLTGLEEKEEEESGSSIHGSETCLCM